MLADFEREFWRSIRSLGSMLSMFAFIAKMLIYSNLAMFLTVETKPPLAYNHVTTLQHGPYEILIREVYRHSHLILSSAGHFTPPNICGIRLSNRVIRGLAVFSCRLLSFYEIIYFATICINQGMVNLWKAKLLHV